MDTFYPCCDWITQVAQKTLQCLPIHEILTQTELVMHQLHLFLSSSPSHISRSPTIHRSQNTNTQLQSAICLIYGNCMCTPNIAGRENRHTGTLIRSCSLVPNIQVHSQRHAVLECVLKVMKTTHNVHIPIMKAHMKCT